ncbi:hypothetical protein [Aureivirga sp. CE67]|uniref:hypothetical protein n=1 Tax=Aureivirga sp. CE67 TaxID=1788983 RepID=UPI0018C91036|nr:hypothetical protein [Aureivirga sp. CE67]
MNHYEQAALVFYTEKNHLMASALFSQGLELEPENSMIWYGFGDSLCHISIQTKKNELYPIGLSCVKKSHLIDAKNPYANSMIERMKNNPNVGEEYMEQLILPNMKLVSKFNITVPDEKLISFFNGIQNVDNKIKLIMHLGETKDVKYYPLLKHCVLEEENQNIRFAALKRIPFFKSENLKEEIFEKIVTQKEVDKYEPYFSIALSSIDEDWTKEWINPDFANEINQKKTFTKEEIKNSLEDEELKAIFGLALLKLEPSKLKEFFEYRNHKAIAFFLTREMNNDGISVLFNKNILNRKGEISELGWKHIELLLDASSNKKGETKGTETNNSKEKEPTKKWWEIWK